MDHRKTLRDMAELMRESGCLRIKPHRDQMVNHNDTFKGECGPRLARARSASVLLYRRCEGGGPPMW
jgi:hypothetical protein